MAQSNQKGLRNMTVGSPAGHIFYFALPLLAGSFLQQLYNMVDSWVVGNYVGDGALAAVGVGFPVIFMFSSLFMGLSNGGTVVIAQFYGAGKMDRVRDAVDTIYTAFVVSAIPITLLAVFLVKPLLFLLQVESAGSYYTTAITKKDVIGSVTLTIRCDKAAGRAAHIPENGVLLAETGFPIAQGDTVYTLLTDAARAHGIHMEASGAKGLMYIHGIGNIYEFDFGELSGWLYTVNGETFSVGVDQYVLKPGDRVEFHYTLELGRDFE